MAPQNEGGGAERSGGHCLSGHPRVRVGAVLPESGVTYREVPAEYGVKEYRYTVVNNRTVLVEPRTRRIVQVIE
ncbi:hypothetical protein B5U98_27495 [Bosea sp. Tri-39]|nr:hypothetical protein B5U98_27495 [Bosea sp. Tri-39]RXT42534.1 hypothetical protein B5U99_00425 [Bosea sp. Tri-54]